MSKVYYSNKDLSRSKARGRAQLKTRRFYSDDGEKEGDLDLNNIDNFDYIGTIYVGNPPVPVRACFDTGSANSWIMSSFCKTEQCLSGNNNIYDPEESYSSIQTKKYASIQFGEGDLNGHFAFDDYRVGRGENAIHIKKQIFGMVEEEHIFDDTYDSIIGLAYPEMSAHGHPMFDSMMRQNLLESNVFAFYMSVNKR